MESREVAQQENILPDLTDLTFEEAQDVNSIFFDFQNYPSFESDEEFEAFIETYPGNIKKVKEAIENDADMSDVIRKEYILGCHYLYAENKRIGYFHLTPEKQRHYIKMCATLSPQEREKIAEMARQQVIKRRSEETKGKISDITN